MPDENAGLVSIVMTAAEQTTGVSHVPASRLPSTFLISSRGLLNRKLPDLFKSQFLVSSKLGNWFEQSQQTRMSNQGLLLFGALFVHMGMALPESY